MSGQGFLKKPALLKDRFISRVFKSGVEAYLVGGYVRDAIRGVRSKDIDFVVRGDIRAIVSNLFSSIKGTIVEFKNAPLIRVVVRDVTLDFSRLEGDIEDDLRKRDFTINSIAWSPVKGIIDPLNGINDIENKLIRGVSKGNFIDDPLRMLRAYRFAAELGWSIDINTRSIIKSLKSLIRQSAPERITFEFFKILNSGHCLNALRKCSDDGLLNIVLSLNKNVLSDRLKTLSKLNTFLKKYDLDLNQQISQELSYIGLIRIESLLHASGRKSLLRMSSSIRKRISSTGSAISRYRRIKDPTPEKLFNLFDAAGGAAMDFAFLTMNKRIVNEADKFLKIKPVMPSEKIISHTGAKGPEIGRLIKKVRCLQFAGKIKDYKSAVSWLLKHSARG